MLNINPYLLLACFIFSSALVHTWIMVGKALKHPVASAMLLKFKNLSPSISIVIKVAIPLIVVLGTFGMIFYGWPRMIFAQIRWFFMQSGILFTSLFDPYAAHDIAMKENESVAKANESDLKALKDLQNTISSVGDAIGKKEK